MADFNDFNKKAGNFAAAAFGKARDFTASAVDKAKRTGRIAKLNLDISSEKETIRHAYADIGKLYYETHKDAPEGFFVQLVEEINTSMAAIALKEAEIAELKTEPDGPDGPDFEAPDFEDADFDTVVTDTEAAAEEDPGEDSPEE